MGRPPHTTPHIIGVYGNTGAKGDKGDKGDTGAAGADGQMLYATCSTAAGTAAKVATLAAGSLTLKAGATVAVRFTNANTAASPTLNVSGTGAKAIYTQGVRYAYWSAGSVVVFTYDGSYWRVASEPVYGSTATIGNPVGYNIYIDGSHMYFRYGQNVLSDFTTGEINLGKYTSISDEEGFITGIMVETEADDGYTELKSLKFRGSEISSKIGNEPYISSILFSPGGVVDIPGLKKNAHEVATLDDLNSKIPSQIKFDYVYYEPNSFGSVVEMLKTCAESLPSDLCCHIVEIRYGSVYSAIIQTYSDNSYRSVFCTSYTTITQNPIYLRKNAGVWYQWDGAVDPISSKCVRIGSIGIYCATVVTTATGSSKTAVTLCTLSQINGFFGTTGSSKDNTAVFASNADAGATDAHIEGCSLDGGTTWKAVTNKSVPGNIRINYTVLRWGL